MLRRTVDVIISLSVGINSFENEIFNNITEPVNIKIALGLYSLEGINVK